jgi:predicted DCC family thiol-disulfide oxidoreductase YuxK
MSDQRIIVYDSVCVLCSRWLKIVLRHDKRALYKFAAVQRPAGQALLSAHGMDPSNPSSFLLLENGVAYSNSDAVIRVLASFGGAWRMANALRWIPAVVRDRAYLTLGRNRYRWFGKLDQCAVPTAATRSRFLD